MTESKSAITRRLMKEGRWHDAEEYKNSIIKQLRTEAREKAWEEMAKRYPPTETVQQEKQ